MSTYTSQDIARAEALRAGFVARRIAEQYGALDPETAPVNFVFQTYHIMVAMYGLIMITAILAIVFTYRKGGRIKNMKWLQRLVLEVAATRTVNYFIKIVLHTLNSFYFEL